MAHEEVEDGDDDGAEHGEEEYEDGQDANRGYEDDILFRGDHDKDDVVWFIVMIEVAHLYNMLCTDDC